MAGVCDTAVVACLMFIFRGGALAPPALPQRSQVATEPDDGSEQVLADLRLGNAFLVYFGRAILFNMASLCV